MYSTDSIVDFTNEDVEEALHFMFLPSPDKHSKILLSLWSVSAYLIRHRLSDTDYSRRFALETLLTRIITKKLTHLRRNYHLPAPNDDASLDEALQSLTKDGAQNNLELVLWSWLYHSYVRVDLNLPPQHFGNLIHLNERTFRRYRKYGIYRLANALRTHEIETYTRYHARRLKETLPDTAPLIGREQALVHLCKTLQKTLVKHVCITGVKGVGKTTFATHLLQQFITEDMIDDYVWIDQPVSIEQITRLLQNHKVPSLSLPEYTQVCRLGIVIDGIDLLENLQSLECLLRELRNAVVLLISNQGVFLRNISTYHCLPPLTKKQTHRLARFATHSRYVHQGWELSAQEQDIIWTQSRGNPFHILQGVHALWQNAYMDG